ncbi:hypothetical protein KKG83_05955 [Candidatus Micrarchaeota archaeon]|nr:hypothetical protein [Candidatus Micrarchaeota archaeon]
MKEELKEFKKFIEDNKEKRTAVLHHTDPDGVCSGIITAKALERITGKKPLLFHQNPGEITVTENTVKELKEKQIQFLVSVDLSVDQNPEPIKEIEEFAKILVLDHHKTYNELNSTETLMIKSKDLTGVEGSKYPVSKLSFDLFSDLTDLKDLDWIACIGLLGDNAYSEWKDFVDGTIEKYGFEKKIEENILFKIKKLIESIEVMDYSKMENLINVFLSAKKPEDLMKKDLLMELEGMEKEVAFWRMEFEQKKEVFPGELIYFELKPEHSIKSVLINRISQRYKNKTIVLVQDFSEEHVYFSARRQDFKVKVNDLLEKAVEGIPEATAGGHIPAAAGRIPRKYLKQFKENLIKKATKVKSEK